MVILPWCNHPRAPEVSLCDDLLMSVLGFLKRYVRGELKPNYNIFFPPGVTLFIEEEEQDECQDIGRDQ